MGQKTTLDTLNSFAPIKKKYTRGNQMSFMTKNHSKEIMTRSTLRNNYLKIKQKKLSLVYLAKKYMCSLSRKNKK